jgi:hypothetical protein
MDTLPCGCRVGPDFEIVAVDSQCKEPAHVAIRADAMRSAFPPQAGPAQRTKPLSGYGGRGDVAARSPTMADPKAGEVYRHYKGDLYTVLHVAKHHDTRVALVVYLSHSLGTVNVRPLWGTEADPDGWFNPPDPATRHRFERVVP